MKKILLLLILFCLIISCEKEAIIENHKIVSFKKTNINTNSTTEYKYIYNLNGLLIEKQTPLTNELISYSNKGISSWISKFSQSTSKKEIFYYKNTRLDSIKINYTGALSGINLIKYFYENSSDIRKVEYIDNTIVNIYEFNYDNLGYLEKLTIDRKYQSTNLIYSYEYDKNGNIIKIYLNNRLKSEFEFLNIDNPFYEISRPYLINIPYDPSFSETELITSKKLISKAKYYTYDGKIESEIINDYKFNDEGLPISGNRIFKGQEENLLFEYK
ncbi:MAG: hypothetical protein R3342_13335 [Lutibacter sp.]|uniref:hypothetical protein n=1 Tax=Lutibacter sp. TaxID=1925666 RepID=UPI00299D8C5E|nr:hypothetical protein [Lutibacter sp.]MDX1830517.1 hypothetical protein [Lutibacter sp.]